ncbi:MAG: tryptophan synthase subunit alpha [Candidatus Levybacteria bacterium]|nr:tryptophan synthase subunit alpha [Candidatus Levybacteria bacterium]
MAHLVVGYLSLEKTISIVKAMEKAGADFVELQIPFSDPLADGPTIMRACENSLANGTKVKDAFAVAQKLSKEVAIPLLFMAYYNTVFKYGVEKFCRDAKKAGITGLIVPDMSIEEESCEHFLQFCKKYSLHNIQVVSPSSTNERLKKNAKVANGFVYVTARQGVTGARAQLDKNLISFLKRVRQYFAIPIAVGFGISKKEHLKVLKGHADIAIVGSAIIDVINRSKGSKIEENISNFIRELKKPVAAV